MIVSKTPLRISLFGGTSDIPEYYLREDTYEGICISTAINSYIYIALHECEAPHLKIVYSELEKVDNLEDLKHDIVRETLKFYNKTSNIEMTSFSNMGTKGTGLGSSSTFTVGFLNALHFQIYKMKMPPQELASTAFYVERELCGNATGKQDQFAAAFGGFNQFTFRKNNEVFVRRFENAKNYLEKRLIVYNTKKSRLSGVILENQKEKMQSGENIKHINQIVRNANVASDIIFNNKDLNELGELFHENWMIKKQVASNISDSEIDEMYDYGIKSGASGGKLIGAGGGGYMLFYVEDQKIPDFTKKMERYSRLEYQFEEQGSTITNLE